MSQRKARICTERMALRARAMAPMLYPRPRPLSKPDRWNWGQADGARDPRQVGADHDADGGERHDHGVAVVAGGGGHEALTPRVGRQRLAGQLRVVRLGLVRERPEEVDDDHPRGATTLRRRRGDGRLRARLGIGAERDAGNGVAGAGSRAGLRRGGRSRGRDGRQRSGSVPGRRRAGPGRARRRAAAVPARRGRRHRPGPAQPRRAPSWRRGWSSLRPSTATRSGRRDRAANPVPWGLSPGSLRAPCVGLTYPLRRFPELRQARHRT